MAKSHPDSLPTEVFEAFAPSRDILLHRVCEIISEDMLVEISKVDYGMDAFDHLFKLREIRETARMPSPLDWKPREVLELVRWSEPDSGRGSSGDHGHVLRAFCCAALLTAAIDPANQDQLFVDSQNDTLLPMIESAIRLGGHLPEALASFLAWRVETIQRDDVQRPFFGFALLALAVLALPDRLNEAQMDSLAVFVDRAEICLRDPGDFCTPGMFSGSFLDVITHDQRHPGWRALAARVETAPSKSERVRALARRIQGV